MCRVNTVLSATIVLPRLKRITKTRGVLSGEGGGGRACVDRGDFVHDLVVGVCRFIRGGDRKDMGRVSLEFVMAHVSVGTAVRSAVWVFPSSRENGTSHNVCEGRGEVPSELFWSQ